MRTYVQRAAAKPGDWLKGRSNIHTRFTATGHWPLKQHSGHEQKWKAKPKYGFPASDSTISHLNLSFTHYGQVLMSNYWSGHP